MSDKLISDAARDLIVAEEVSSKVDFSSGVLARAASSAHCSECKRQSL